MAEKVTIEQLYGAIERLGTELRTEIGNLGGRLTTVESKLSDVARDLQTFRGDVSSRFSTLERRQGDMEYRLNEVGRLSAEPSRAGYPGMFPGLQPFELDGASVAGGAFVPAPYPKLR